MKKMIAFLLTLALALTAVCAMAEGSLTFSWWGGDARHEATQQAVEAFKAATGIDVQCTYSAWSGWEDKMSQYFASDSAFDVNQINWNWLYSFTNADGSSKFYDLNQVADVIDLSQFSEKALAQCTIDGQLLAIPVSMTGRIFYWNKTTFDKAGISYPTTLDELMAAGKTFQEKLGDDYYPLHLGAYDRMILMVFYLESKYGKDWADPVTSTLNYTEDEIAEGLAFIKSLVDNHVMMNLKTYYSANSDTATHQSNEWITGKIAGIFEWDSAASKYQDALDEENKAGFTVGDEIKFGDYNGGFSKVSMGLAITKTCEHPAEAATLINFLLNEEKGASIMGSECGIPASTAGLAAAQAADAVKPLVLEANTKVLAFVDMPLDPYYESSKLKDTTDGIYTDVFDGLSYDEYDPQEAAEILLDGVSGGLAGAIGLALADIMAGDPGYAITTYILKFIIGIVCGVFAHKVFKLQDLSAADGVKYYVAVIGSAFSGLLVNVFTDPFLGYFRNIYIFGQEYTVAQALSKIAGGVTFVNSVASTICVVILYLALRPALERAGLLPKGEKK